MGALGAPARVTCGGLRLFSCLGHHVLDRPLAQISGAHLHRCVLPASWGRAPACSQAEATGSRSPAPNAGSLLSPAAARPACGTVLDICPGFFWAGGSGAVCASLCRGRFQPQGPAPCRKGNLPAARGLELSPGPAASSVFLATSVRKGSRSAVSSWPPGTRQHRPPVYSGGSPFCRQILAHPWLIAGRVLRDAGR